MTNEQLAVYLAQLRDRLSGEIESIEAELPDDTEREQVAVSTKVPIAFSEAIRNALDGIAGDVVTTHEDGRVKILIGLYDLLESIDNSMDSLLNVSEMDLSGIEHTHFEQ